MNWYVTLSSVKSWLGLTGTGYDTALAELIEEESREADRFCNRHFYADIATKYFDGHNSEELEINDLLIATTVTADSENDHTYDGETWVQGTDYDLRPDNSWPKLRLWVPPNGNYSFSETRERYIKIVGQWGYGDGRSATPYEATSVTGTVATTGGTTLTVSADGTIKQGHTILIETEQMFVSAVGTLSATVERGVNGTTAATHSGKAISIYQYPPSVQRWIKTAVSIAFNQRKTGGLYQQRIGNYSEMYMTPSQLGDARIRVLGSLRDVRAK